MTPAIRLSRAVVLLGRFPALAGADLVVERGEVVHLAGPNGAGKTTILRTCAGLHPLASGEAHVLGVDLRRDRRAIRRRVGLLGHEGFLYDDLTVAENVRFSVRAAGCSASSADEALERLGLDNRLRDVPVANLSTGQRRRTALAAIVARQPELLLLDEPHAALDASGRDIVDELIATSSTAGTAVVLASHEHERISSHTTRTRQLVVIGGEVHDHEIAPTTHA